jgi:hypothetical protein
MSSLIAKPRLIGGPLAFIASLVVAALVPTPPVPVIAGVGCATIGMLLEIMVDLEDGND